MVGLSCDKTLPLFRFSIGASNLMQNNEDCNLTIPGEAEVSNPWSYPGFQKCLIKTAISKLPSVSKRAIYTIF